MVTYEMFEIVLHDTERHTDFEHNRMAFIAGAAIRMLDKEMKKTWYEAEPRPERGGGGR